MGGIFHVKKDENERYIHMKSKGIQMVTSLFTYEGIWIRERRVGLREMHVVKLLTYVKF